MTELNGNRYIVSNQTTDTFEITDEEGNDIDSSAFNTYLSGGKIRKCVTTITGLDHLEGKAVSVLSNGSVIQNKTVSSGSITLPYRASRVHVGLGYYSDIETLDYSIDNDKGVTRDKAKDLKEAVILCKDTRAMWAGTKSTNIVEVPFRVDEVYGDPTALFTGEKVVRLETGDTRASSLFIRNIDPLPMNILALIARVDFGNN